MSHMEELETALGAYRRDEVLELLRQGVLKECADEQKRDVYSRITALRDLRLTAEMVKEEQAITPDMFQIDFDNHHNREYVARVLKKYAKKQKSGAEYEEAFFELACRTGETGTALSMIKEKKAADKYPLLASAPEPLFALIRKIDRRDLDANLRVAMLWEAARSADPVRRLDELCLQGYEITEKNDAGKNVKMLMEEQIASNRYTKNKNGDLKRKRDKTVLAHIEKISVTPPAKEKGPWWSKALPAAVVILAVCVIGLMIALFLGKARDESGNADQGETADAVEDLGAGDAAPSYATDTSLEVADGDTVNIDYVGYVDDVAFEGGNTEGRGTDLTIGSGSYIDDFEEQLIGHKVGEQVTVEVTFPEDYGQEELNGKDARFEVTINGIYQ